jgi:hypothetical protein
MPKFEPYIPKDVNEIIEVLATMMLTSPKFKDLTGYFPQTNINTIFHELNEGLQLSRGKLGEARYLELKKMSDQMRAHFDADPEDETGESRKGRAIILEMMDILKRGNRRS